MKSNVTLFFVLLYTLSSCVQNFSAKTDEGAKNAIEYVREKIQNSPMYSLENVEEITAVPTDSLVTTVSLPFYSRDCSRAYIAYYSNQITKDSLRTVLDKVNADITAIQNCWQYHGLLDNQEWKVKNKHLYRKVYTVTIKWKSAKTQDIRVLMDNNGILPFGTEKEVAMELKKAVQEMLEMYNDIENDY